VLARGSLLISFGPPPSPLFSDIPLPFPETPCGYGLEELNRSSSADPEESFQPPHHPRPVSSSSAFFFSGLQNFLRLRFGRTLDFFAIELTSTIEFRACPLSPRLVTFLLHLDVPRSRRLNTVLPRSSMVYPVQISRDRRDPPPLAVRDNSFSVVILVRVGFFVGPFSVVRGIIL